MQNSPRIAGAKLLALALLLIVHDPLQGQTVLVEDSFTGAAGAAPDATKFDWSGQLGLTGSGQLGLSTDTANTSRVYSKAGTVVSAGDTLLLQMRAAAYAEPAVYGDKQPRGLRVGTDANNAIEFFSQYGTTLGMRCYRDGVPTVLTQSFPTGVTSMNDYEIVVTPDSATFKVNGTVTGTISTNIPTGRLNAFAGTYDGGFGNVPLTLDSLTLTFTPAPAGTAPLITDQPDDVTVDAMSGASFSVTATGTAPLSYQWKKSGTNIEGATTDTLNLTNVQVGDAAIYHVLVSNSLGGALSNGVVLTVNRLGQTITFDALADMPADHEPFTLGATAGSGLAVSYSSSNTAVATVDGQTVTLTGTGQTTLTAQQPGNGFYLPAENVTQTLTVTGLPPGITVQPAGATVDALSNVSLGVTATGTATLAYQWRKDGALIEGATAASLDLANVSTTDAGTYCVTITNDWGDVTSDDAVLVVNRLPQAITFDALATKRCDDAPFALTATAGSGLAVAYSSSNLAVATVAGNMVTLRTYGQAVITASQPGNEYYLAAPEVTQTLSVTGVPPAITAQPVGASVAAKAGASFSVTATGSEPLNYQWKKDGANVGSNSPNLGLTNVAAGNAGSYSVVVTNAWDSATSEEALLVVNRLAQALTFEPLATMRLGAAPLTLTAAASSGLPVSYESSNPAVATVSGNVLTLVGLGETTLTARQAGDGFYQPAGDLARVLQVEPMPGAVAAWGANANGQTTVPDGLGGVKAIAAGLHHVVALKDDGTVVAWGLNTNGQATVPSGLTGVKSVAAGYFHSVALKADGTVVAWGYNSNGQAAVPAGLTAVTAIAAGYYHTVALKSDGTVQAWGYNGDGQTTVPAGLTNVMAIAAGSGHSVALKDDGTVVAWGYNGYGQTTVPTGLIGVTAIAAGGYHTIALESNSTVTAWGYDGYGQRTIPSGLTGVTAVAAGYFHSLALKTNGTMTAWGHNTSGQATVPAGLCQVTTIAAGGEHSVALVPAVPAITVQPVSLTVNALAAATLHVTVTGTAPFSYQWYMNGAEISGATSASLTIEGLRSGHAGNYTVAVTNAYGSAASSTAVLTVNRLPQTITFGDLPDKRVDDAAFALTAASSSGLAVNYASSNTSVAVINGNTLTITGSGGTTITASRPADDTYQAASATRVLRVAGMPGVVVAWGANGSGQTTVPEDLIDVTAVAAGGGHTLVLKSDGSVRAWGANSYGQCNVPAGLAGVVAIAAGKYHSVALKADGSVVAWGYNNSGQINVPGGLTNVRAIAAGGYHTVALKADGTTQCWGSNGSGQLVSANYVKAIAAGLNHTTIVRVDGMAQVYGLSAAEPDAVAAGGGLVHALILKANGTVTCVGSNTYGQLDVPADLTDVVAVAAGGNHSLALKNDGSVVAWGYNNLGQTTVPGGMGRVAAIAAGEGHSLALAVVDAPTISSLSSVSGTTGASVTIRGSGLTRATEVKFNGTAATFTITSDTELVATVPDYAGSGPVTVTNPTATASSSSNFTVLPAVVAEATEASLDAALASHSAVVTFTCSETIYLASTKVIDGRVSLDGTGQTVTLSGDGLVRLVTVNAGANLTLRNLTLANGSSVTAGGGIYNNGGTVTAEDCTFSNNQSVGDGGSGNASGGAIYNHTGGLLVVNRCTFTGNRANGSAGATGAQGTSSAKTGSTGGYGGSGYGGGICNNGGSATITNCTFNSNSASGGNGGTGGRGFDGYQQWVDDPWPYDGHWTTVSGGYGGRGGDGGNGYGGSIHNAAGTVTMLHVTVARGAVNYGHAGGAGSPGNYAYSNYGAGYAGSTTAGRNLNNMADATMTVTNCLIAYGSGNASANCAGTLADQGGNLCTDASAAFFAAGSYNNIDTLLGSALASNGGTTQTLRLSASSPAINAAIAAGAPTVDQRGYGRSGLADSGAYEFQVPVVTGFAPASGPAGTQVVIGGSNFHGVTAVRFGGIDASFTCDSPTQLTATAPAYATSGPITVVSTDGTGVSGGDFEVTSVQFTYVVSNGEVAITGYLGNGGTVVIPAMIGGLPVTSLAERAFAALSAVTAVVIPAGVTRIGEFAFSGCPNLTAVTIPSTVTTIGRMAFIYCGKLEAITVDALNPVYRSVDGVLFTHDLATLIQCPGGKTGHYLVPAGVQQIGEAAFHSCALTAVTMPASITRIGDWAFTFCSALAGVYFQGDAPATSGESAFVFNAVPNVKVYRLPATDAWAATFAGRLVVMVILPGETAAPQIHLNGPTVILTIPESVVGRRYQLQCSESLTGGNWTNVGESMTGDGNELLLTAPRNSAQLSCFYRIALE